MLGFVVVPAISELMAHFFETNPGGIIGGSRIDAIFDKQKKTITLQPCNPGLPPVITFEDTAALDTEEFIRIIVKEARSRLERRYRKFNIVESQTLFPRRIKAKTAIGMFAKSKPHPHKRLHERPRF